MGFWHVAVPMLKPISLYVSVVTLISSFTVYGQALVLASDSHGAPGRQVRVLAEINPIKHFVVVVRGVLLKGATLAEVADHVVTLAEAEDLPGHGAAVSVRVDR